MNLFSFLNGWKTYLAAAGAFGLALHQFSQGDFVIGFYSLIGAVATFGGRQAIARHADATNAQLKLMKAHLIEMRQQSQSENK